MLLFLLKINKNLVKREIYFIFLNNIKIWKMRDHCYYIKKIIEMLNENINNDREKDP
jgi:hypothetical protein